MEQRLVRSHFLTNRMWQREALKNENVIICKHSALECLELFDGYLYEDKISVLALQQGSNSNLDYMVVPSFDGIDICRFGTLVCTSLNQTINDMLSDYDNCDDEALAQSLSNYFYDNGETFDGLKISEENTDKFNEIASWAVDYYSNGER